MINFYNKKVKCIIGICSSVLVVMLIIIRISSLGKSGNYGNKEVKSSEETIKDTTSDKQPVKQSITLSEVAEMVGVREERNKGFTGKGITIAIIDTGVYEHDDLIKPKNRILKFKDFINDADLPYDDSGHGTAIAGIIAGNGFSNNDYIGMAPDANLVVIKALTRTENAKLSVLIDSLNWVIENKEKYNIKILNLSLGLVVRDNT
ncbi:MAG TPA: S8 family serine peptidase, partial [Clostridia bacterium]